MRAKVWKIFRNYRPGRNNWIHRALLLGDIQAQQLTDCCPNLATNCTVLAHHRLPATGRPGKCPTDVFRSASRQTEGWAPPQPNAFVPPTNLTIGWLRNWPDPFLIAASVKD